MTRLLLRFAAVACIAPLAAACGGGGSHAALVPPSQTAPQPLDAPAAVPQAAARGLLVSVHLPLRNADELDGLIQRQADKNSPDYHHFLTPQQFRERFGPTTADLSTAAESMRGLGFEAHVTSQGILASAPQATVERTFSVHLSQTLDHGRSTMGADRAVTLPASLARVGATVGVFSRLMHVNSMRVSAKPIVDNRYSTVGSYWFTDLKQAYGYPAYQTANGRGRTIAIIIDSDILDSDSALYFGHEKLAPPVVERRPVNGGPTAFNPGSGESFEASLDVQQSFGSAPGAHIMLYGVPQLSQDNIAAALSAIDDDNRADIVNMSFGLCELYYTAAYNGGTDFTYLIKNFHDLFRQGNAQGITFVNASGDSGAYECTDVAGSTYIKGVQNPSDDPLVTSVGGTNLVTNHVAGSLNSSYVRESEFFDTFDASINAIWGSGGGISVLFPKPWYQYLVQTHANTRTIPDVAMHMGGCPVGSQQPCNPDDSADLAVIGGSLYGIIGTSASSPDFAGLLAVTEQTAGTRLGNANGYIYVLATAFGSGVYRQNIPGNNGYPARNGYDYVTGVGTPKAADFALQPFAPHAGNPQTATNP